VSAPLEQWIFIGHATGVEIGKTAIVDIALTSYLEKLERMRQYVSMGEGI
jgi:hypothetical protein